MVNGSTLVFNVEQIYHFMKTIVRLSMLLKQLHNVMKYINANETIVPVQLFLFAKIIYVFRATIAIDIAFLRDTSFMAIFDFCCHDYDVLQSFVVSPAFCADQHVLLILIITRYRVCCRIRRS